MNVVGAIEMLYPNAVKLVDFVVRDEGKGQYIYEWNLPYPQPTIEELANAQLTYLKRVKKEDINARCQQTILGGFTASNGHSYAFDFKDQDNFTQQMLFLVHDPTITEIPWNTNEGVVVHTRDEFLQVCQDANAHKTGNFKKYWTLLAQLESATTEDEINAIGWS
jgi:hypothetical protein